ncbi:uncharacterized protein LOC122056750 [Zingiber officinale]|uniref:uncharacterized protein LOC122056750 n=1 Tax=Zingiber officinale TaxID=94328 RepID=UPI001C4B61C3|nr:uncharacterized protein LOC122056750 [Zingiber officinale]
MEDRLITHSGMESYRNSSKNGDKCDGNDRNTPKMTSFTPPQGAAEREREKEVDYDGAQHDRSTRRMIDFGCESHGLYQLQQSSLVGSVAASPLLIHAQLGHPSRDKLKQLHPSLSHLESLSCESCQLSKHVHSSFSTRTVSRATTPFVLIHSDV